MISFNLIYMVAFVPPSGNEKPLGPWTINKILLTRDRPEKFPPFFVCSLQWNQNTMR